WRACGPLLSLETFERPLAGMACPRAATGSPEPQSSKAEASSSSILPFLTEHLSAERGGQMLVYQYPAFPLFLPDPRVPHGSINCLAILHFCREVHRHGGPD